MYVSVRVHVRNKFYCEVKVCVCELEFLFHQSCSGEQVKHAAFCRFFFVCCFCRFSNVLHKRMRMRCNRVCVWPFKHFKCVLHRGFFVCTRARACKFIQILCWIGLPIMFHASIKLCSLAAARRLIACVDNLIDLAHLQMPPPSFIRHSNFVNVCDDDAA